MTAALPEFMKALLLRLESEGYAAYMVGGCVRDLLIGRAPHDWDAATDALPEAVMGLFPDSALTGAAHGTVTVRLDGHSVEVTTFRAEGEYRDHRRPDSVSFIGDLHADLSRRDFTMNAVAAAASGLVVDPFGGRRDMERALIRCVGEPALRFSEDALRMLRAVRFSAQLGFGIERETGDAIRASAGLAACLSPERVRDELEKILLSPRPWMASELFSLGLMDAYTLRPRAGIDFLRASLLPPERLGRWAALGCVLERDGLVASTREFLQALRLDRHTIQRASVGAALALQGPPESARDWKGILAEHEIEAAEAAASASQVLRPGNDLETLRLVLHGGDCFSLGCLAVDGGDVKRLGLRGPAVGRALNDLLRIVLDHPEKNEKEILLEILRIRLAKTGNAQGNAEPENR